MLYIFSLQTHLLTMREKKTEINDQCLMYRYILYIKYTKELADFRNDHRFPADLGRDVSRDITTRIPLPFTCVEHENSYHRHLLHLCLHWGGTVA